MALYRKREKFQGFSMKIGLAFSRLGLSPNQWTVFTLVPTIIALFFLVKDMFLWAALFFFITSFIDLVDGSVARVTGRVTKLGAYLDTVMDRYVEGIIIFGLLFTGLPDLFLPFYAWIFIYFFGGLMTTYAKAAAMEKGIVNQEIRGGLMERAERLLILFIGILLAYFDAFYLMYVIVILAVLSNITALQRIGIVLRKGRKK